MALYSEITKRSSPNRPSQGEPTPVPIPEFPPLPTARHAAQDDLTTFEANSIIHYFNCMPLRLKEAFLRNSVIDCPHMIKELIDTCYSSDSESDEEAADGREARGEEDINGPSKGHPTPLRTPCGKRRIPDDIIRALTPGKPPATSEPTAVNQKTPKKSTTVAATNSKVPSPLKRRKTATSASAPKATTSAPSTAPKTPTKAPKATPPFPPPHPSTNFRP